MGNRRRRRRRRDGGDEAAISGESPRRTAEAPDRGDPPDDDLHEDLDEEAHEGPEEGPEPWSGTWYEVRYLSPPGRRGPSWREIERSLAQVDLLVRDAPGCFLYRNPDTHVQCWFLGYRPAVHDEVGLAFRMALPRPEHFAHEALPLAVQVARELRLETLYPLPGGGLGAGEPTQEGLLAGWLRCNREALEACEAEEGPRPGCDGDAMELAWEYLVLRDELERRYLRRGVAVPGIEYLRHRKTGRVLRAARWVGLGPTIIPPVDLVYLERPPAPLKSGRIVPVEALAEQARRWVKDVPQPIFHRFYGEASPPDEFLKILEGLDGKTMRSYDPVPVEDLKDL